MWRENRKVEVTIPVKGTIIRSEQVSTAMYVSIDLVEEIRIVRTKRFDFDFYVFINAETDQVNVVYKRKGDTYGLIEPEI